MLQQCTPPPDTYGHIQPCTHLTAVLETKAHDTVIETYTQGVAVSIALNPLLSGHTTYLKNGTPVPGDKLREHVLRVVRCAECAQSNFNSVFFCLQCPHVGCYGSHARDHATKHSHLFGIDSHTGLLYCFACDDYINHAALNAIRLAAVAAPPAAAAPELAHYTRPLRHGVLGLKGIVNLGATCFMSCVLQVLVHNPLVRLHFFNNDLHYFHCSCTPLYAGGDPIDERLACITCSVDGVFKELFTAHTHEGLGITNLLVTAWHKNRLLAGFQEQDAHEFMQFLLNEFHLDHERVARAAGRSETACQCVVHRTFSGLLASRVRCSACGSESETVDPLVDLSLEINHKKNPSLYDCLNQFTHNELLENYHCTGCKQQTRAHKQLRFKHIPPVLTIQLKRFKHNSASDTASKLETAVLAPLFLNLTHYAVDSHAAEVDPSKVYELFAVVCHKGSVNTGHYIAMVKTASSRWLKFDDSVITHVSVEEVQATNAYLLYYIAHAI